MITATSTFKASPRARAGILEAIARGASAGAELVAEEARMLAPVDTGELRSSIDVQPPVEQGTSVSVRVVASAAHAAYVEYGTGQRGQSSPGAGPGPYDPNWPGMVAQPYMRPALDTRRAEVLAEIAAEVRGAV